MNALCGLCKAPGHWSEPVSVILLFAPGLERPYPLIPEDGEEYRACIACDGMSKLVDKAQAAHPVVAKAGPWTRAVVVCDDGQGYDVREKFATQAPGNA